MIGNNYALQTRDSWCLTPGHECFMTNNENGNPVRIDFIDNNEVVFFQLLTYDSNNAVTRIQCLTE